MKTYSHWIGGEMREPVCGQWIETVDPYRAVAWAKIARGSEADADLAVAAATRAMTTGPWAAMSATERGKILRRIGDLVLAHADQLAELEVRDNGKLLSETRGQLKFKAEYWYYYSGLADKIEGSVVPIEKPDILAFTRPEPVGVVLALTAWNSPLIFLAIKCAPALAAGCAVIVKPSEFSSVSSLEFAALTKQAGLPDGVLNVVTGYGNELGGALADPQVLEVAKKVVPVSDSGFDWKGKLPDGRIDVVMNDGKSFDRQGSNVPGSPDRPMTWDELDQKFDDCARAAIRPVPAETIKRIQLLVRGLEQSDDATELMRLLA